MLEFLVVKKIDNAWRIVSGQAIWLESYQTKQAAKQAAIKAEKWERQYGSCGCEYTSNPAN